MHACMYVVNMCIYICLYTHKKLNIGKVNTKMLQLEHIWGNEKITKNKIPMYEMSCFKYLGT